ncbi:Ferredoxin [Frankia sp. AiPs1]|uniref:hypothetical protein n=1 Tax=Frankia sp. AiPa1 TaxID=573492 RepID=UPI00202B060A|nr:hypothetical protein [Frankia sp. AiPa1]MCL9758057.1 hypothetical protein [Frankia sp. AiPa1]
MELVRVSLDDLMVFDCAVCGGERAFEQPSCADGHGPDCPEWACTGCGHAVLVGPAPAVRGAGRGSGNVLSRESAHSPEFTARAGSVRAGSLRESSTRGIHGQERSAPRIPA